MPSSFSTFALSPEVLRGVAKLGFTEPTPVQAAAIPLLLAGQDAIVQAKTGSGKTLAFGLPLLTLLKPSRRPQALIILPTRELAQQVCTAIATVAPDGPLRVLPVYGGVGLAPQEVALRRGVDVVVGTPGRLKDLLGRGSLDLTAISVLVLDEADQMLDMGFRRDMEFLINRMPARAQTLIFSATMPPEIEAIARTHLKDPAMVRPTAAELTPDLIEHFFVRVGTDARLDALVHLLGEEDPERAIVFTRMKHETKRLALKLEGRNAGATGYLNGNMSQNARNTMLARFRAGELRTLVATDVAARGLDIEGLTHVFHYAVPTVVDTYIHRSGRTGRAGQSGKTFTLVTPDDASDFAAIRKKVSLAEVRVPASVLVSSEPDVSREPAPPRQPRGGGRMATARVPVAAPAIQNGEMPWRRFKVALEGDASWTPGEYVRKLSQQTGLPAREFRDMRLTDTHAVFEVAPASVDRFLSSTQERSAAPRGAARRGRRH